MCRCGSRDGDRWSCRGVCHRDGGVSGDRCEGVTIDISGTIVDVSNASGWFVSTQEVVVDMRKRVIGVARESVVGTQEVVVYGHDIVGVGARDAVSVVLVVATRRFIERCEEARIHSSDNARWDSRTIRARPAGPPRDALEYHVVIPESCLLKEPRVPRADDPEHML